MITREFPPEPGGISYYVYNLSKKLVEKGHKVTIITRGSVSRTTKDVVDDIIVYKVSFFPIYPLHLYVHGLFINSFFKNMESQFDIVHLHSPLVPPIKTSLPVVTTVHTPMKVDAIYHEVFNYYSLAEKLQSLFFSPSAESKLFKISDSINSVSFAVAEELAAYGLDPKKLRVVRNGVDETIFKPSTNVDTSKKYVLYTGILRARKGLFDLLECAESVYKVYPMIDFIVCGKGPYFRTLSEEVQKRNLKNFKLLGYVEREELIRLYQNATIHVVPSHYEGLPTVLLEAMACGLPVVATNIGGNKEVITNCFNGLLVPPKNPQSLANAILKLLNDKKLRKRLGTAARETIEKYYTWDKIAENLIMSYRSVLKQSQSS